MAGLRESAPLALTAGEPSGIGGEITLAAWMRRADRRLPIFFVLDDPARLEAMAERLGWPVPCQTIQAPEEAVEVFDEALPVLPVAFAETPKPGAPDPANAAGVLRSIEMAVHLTLDRRASAMVTNPIQKESLYRAGFARPGHTEFLAELAGRFTDQPAPEPVMMLLCKNLRVVPVTVHMPLRDAIRSLSVERIVTVARIVNAALTNDFGCTRPRLAAAGLNPHAGEGGSLGREEIEIITPALDRLRAEGVEIEGPLSADTMFHQRARAGYDAALGMYHDQALIPIKTLDFDRGVNVTLGLPFVRSSPDHGTALAIAGRGSANPDSLIAALQAAAAMAERRTRNATAAKA